MKLVPVLKIGGEWLDAGAAARRGLVLAERAENGVRRASLENRSGATVRPEQLGWRKEGRCDFDVPGLLFHAEAWQVVGPCGVRRWNDGPFDYSPEYLPNCVSTPEDFHPGRRGHFLSDNLCCLRRPDGAVRLFGFTTGADRFGHFAAKLGPDGAEEFLALCACDRAELPPGGRIETESLLVLDGADADALLAAFADRWAADSGARRRFAPPVGWCSWYYYFHRVTLADVVENMDWFAARRDDPDFAKVRYIQLDDGWQTALGDWRGANERFPGGLARFADEAKRRGFTPGVWVAPFAAEEGSAVAAEHPDWLVRDDAGAPVSTMKWRGGSRIFALDATRPDVLAHLESLFRDIRALGIDYVKLDFCMLESTAPDAVYHDRTATRAQALRRGFEAIRRGFGDDGFILGGTMVFAPAVGLVDAMRVSTDITPYWDRPGQHAEAPNVPNVCRNIVHHAYMDGRLWINDPDTLIVREDHNDLTPSEVELWARVVSLAGGSLMLSDRMSTLSPERLALVRRALAEAGAPTRLRPVDRWERTLPAVWEAEKGGRTVRAVFDFDRAHAVRMVKRAARLLLALALPAFAQNPATNAAPAADGGFAALYADEVHFAEDGRERPSIANGTFHLGGRPVFFLGPWIYNHTKEDWPPDNPDPQGVGHFAYRELPGKAVFERVGFNASQLSAAWSLPGQALYGLDVPEDWARREEEKAAFFGRFGDQPMVVDFAFGFAGALKKQRPELWKRIEQKNPHWHEFIPVCPESPEGDAYYRDYLKGGAVSALRGGANVFLWELFNESSYLCQCPSNAAAFAREMAAEFGDIGAANRAWGTDYADFGAVAAETDFFGHPRLWPDYAKFLARRYAAILRGYADFVRSIDGRGNVHFTEQSSVGSLEKERGAGVDYRLVADALDVLAYEGGFPFGRTGAALAAATEMEDVVFGKAGEHFFDLDLYRALSRGAKPIVNDELYCQRIENGRRVPSKREDLATVHWAELFHGSSGAFSYCWAKRAWEWKDLDGAHRIAEKPSYKSAHLLNPYAWPPEELDGFRMFMDELEPFRDRILDFPRTSPASVAIVFSYPTVRMLGHVRMDYRERLVRWHGAVLGAHYPVEIVFEEDLPAGLPPDVRALVVPSARFATPEGAAAASRLAEAGITVIADRDAFLCDERGDPLSPPSGKIIRLDADSDASVAPLLAALAASGARRDATLALEKTGRPPRGSDVQIIDRGDFKLLYFVAFGEDATQGGVLRWNIADAGAFYLSDPIHKRLLLNGAQDTWDAAALSNGVLVAVPPQERALFVLSREPPADGYARVDKSAMRALLAEAQAREAPALADYARHAAEADAAHAEARVWRDVDAARCTPIPIAGSANMAFADEAPGDRRGGWFDQGSNDFATMPLGRRVLAGVPFEIADPAANDGRAAIVLFGKNRDCFPASAPEIPVGLAAKRLYFLHAYGWDEPAGTPVLTYRIRYADGERIDFICRARMEIGPWHGTFVPSDAKLAVESSNPMLGRVNVQCARWTNPRPDVEIVGIEPVSACSAAVPAIVAITAEQ